MTAADQKALGVVDIVVPEPGEGAHTIPPRPRGDSGRSSSTGWPRSVR